MKVCQKNLTDDNTITTAQVKTIKGKGWTVLRNDGENWVGYAGRGDTNYNGFIDETDLKNIVQAIMGKTPSNVQKDECDVNADGKVNAADAVGAVNEIKGK